MEFKYSKRISSNTSSNSSSLRNFSSSHVSLQKSPILKQFFRKLKIPFAVLSTSFLFGFTPAKAHAEFNLNPLKNFSDDWYAVKNWFKELPHNIAEWSIDLMAKLYDLCASLILKTPLWIFDNQWFQNTTYKFSLIAIAIVSVLTAIEGIKRMFPFWNKRNKKTMDLKDISKRWFLISGAIIVAPFLFQKVFQGLNWVSETLIKMNVDNIKMVSLPQDISLFDMLILVLFDGLLISTLIPILWKNGRRFFDIMILAVSSPFALSAWVFDSYRGYFNQWWSSLKHLSLVQVYHALYLLILGWFIFGVPTPTNFIEMIVKLLVVVGGFSRMQNPPRIIANKLDHGGGLDEFYDNAIRTINNTKRNIEFTKGIIYKKPKMILSTLSKDRMSSAKILKAKKDTPKPSSYKSERKSLKPKRRK